MKTCDELGIIASTQSINGTTGTIEQQLQRSLLRYSRHRLEWKKLLTLLLNEYKRPTHSGMQNQLALQLCYYIILSMIQLDPKSHKTSILILPHVLIELNLLDATYNFLKLIQFRKVPTSCLQSLRSFTKEGEKCSFCISEPFVFCDEKCDTFLLLDLIYIKIQYKKRLNELESLWQMFRMIEKDYVNATTIFQTIAPCLGVSGESAWKRINPLVLERQALDLVKLIMRINPFVLPKFIGSAERTPDRQTLKNMPQYVRLSLNRWHQDVDALLLLKSAVIDCKQYE